MIYYRCTLVLVLLFIFCALGLSLNAENLLDSQISHSFYFESHGRDDLREWRAAILKGAQYIKIDFNLQTPEYCSQQHRLPENYNFSQGCFLLVHSFQNHTFWGANALDFNTTFDIADWLSDDANLDVMSIRKIVFQVCFKGKPNSLCDGSLNSQHWIKNMDDFYAMVQPIISNSSRIPEGYIQFVFDELDQDDQCVLSRWRPWNSTWIGEAGTGEDNNNGVNETFQMVNMETSWRSSWQHLNNTNMGKFQNGSYAMVAWEPVDETSCNNFFAYFRSFRYVHHAGVILAFNADPSIFHVFTANETSRYSHYPFAPEQSLTPVMWHMESQDRILTASLVSTDDELLVLSVHKRGPRGTFTLESSVPLLVNAADAFGGGLTAVYGVAGSDMPDGSYTVYLAGANGQFATLEIQLNPSGGAVLMVNVTTFTVTKVVGPGSSPAVWSGAFTTVNGSLLLVAAYSVQSTGDIALDIFSLSQDSSPVTVLDGFILNQFTAVADEGINVALSTSLQAGAVTDVLISWARQRQVYSSFVQFQYVSSTGSYVLNQVVPSPSSAAVKVGVGKNPFATFSPRDPVMDTTSVLLSYGWSFCYNDMVVDDDAVTMTSIKICDLRDSWYTNLFEIISNPVNSYVFAPTPLFVNEIVRYSSGNETPHLNGFATTCSDTVFHGIFDIGYNASVLLLPRRDDDVDIVAGGFLGVAALTSLTWPWVSVSFCGNPLPHNGQLVMDSFPLFGFYNESAL